MKILLTNDDGYNSTGIKIVKEKLTKLGHEVYVVAPETGMSAKSASLSIGIPLKIIEQSKDVYSVSGTPCDCVALAIEFFKKERNIDFDLVVSGCNNGPNLSYDTIYSGTIGAALEALTYRKKAIAFSCPYDHFEFLEQGFEMAWEFINKNNLISSEHILNINFPNSDIKGVQLSREYYRKDNNYFTKEIDGYYAYRYMDDLANAPKDSDCYLVEHGVISVCPIGKSYFNESLYNKLKIWYIEYILLTDNKKE